MNARAQFQTDRSRLPRHRSESPSAASRAVADSLQLAQELTGY